MNNSLECPVDFAPVNEHKVRFVALLVLIINIVFIVTTGWVLPAFLAIDFLLRSFFTRQYSVLGFIAGNMVKWFNVGTKPVDRAPKRFAAGIGLVFSIAISILSLIGFAQAAIAFSIILVVFASLEAFTGFCAGCYVYTLGRKLVCPFKKMGLS